MSETGIPTEQFTADLKRLGATYGREIKGELLAEFHRFFGGMTPENFKALVDWAIQNLDAPFPTIARLRRGAMQLGFLKPDAAMHPGQSRDSKPKGFPFVYQECPRCEGTFVVLKSRLVQYAVEDAVFVCVNQMQWGCPITFRARDLAERELKTNALGGIQ